MERTTKTVLGDFTIINVKGAVNRYTMYITKNAVVVAPYYIYIHEHLKLELTGFSPAVTQCRYFETDVIEILPQPGRTGHELIEIVKNLLRMC